MFDIADAGCSVAANLSTEEWSQSHRVAHLGKINLVYDI